MTKDEALKLALEALKKAHHAMQTDMAQDQIEEAITKCEEALAQPPLPVQPERRWVGLTAQEAAECWTGAQSRHVRTNAVQIWENFEAKLKDKNECA